MYNTDIQSPRKDTPEKNTRTKSNREKEPNVKVLEKPNKIKYRKAKYPIPRNVTFNNFPGTGRTNDQILKDILRIVDRYIVPLDQKKYIETLLKYSVDAPEMHESGLPFMKSDMLKLTAKYKEQISEETMNDKHTRKQVKVNNLTHELDSILPTIQIEFLWSNNTTTRTKVLIDTGSSASIIPESLIDENDEAYIKEKYDLVTTSGTDDTTLIGNTTLDILLKGTEWQEDEATYTWTFIITKNQHLILGMDFLDHHEYAIKNNKLTINRENRKSRMTIQINNKSKDIPITIKNTIVLEKGESTSIQLNSTELAKKYDTTMYNHIDVKVERLGNFLKITNEQYEPYTLEKDKQIGFETLSNENSNSIYEAKPWIPNKKYIFSSLIQDKTSYEELENGSRIPILDDIENCVTDELDLPIEDEFYNEDSIKHDHMSKEDWKSFKEMLLTVTIRGKYKRALMSSAWDLGLYKKRYLPIKLIEGHKVNERRIHNQ